MRLRPAVVAAFLVVLAVVRMAATFRVFSATIDEGTHISAALEIYQFHQYRVQRENPPPPRVVMGLAPYLGGMRFNPDPPWPQQLKTPFYDHGKYERNLALARAGNLLFFILAAFGVWLLAREDLGAEGAMVAVFLFSMEPIVIGYSALATHDAAAVAGSVVPLLAFRKWLRDPILGRAVVFGAAYGFGILCKFSCLVYVPAACVALTVVRLLHDATLRRRFARALPAVVPAAVVTLLTVWAGYAFEMGPRSMLQPFEHGFGPRGIQILAHIDPATRIPAPTFFMGIAALILDGRAGIVSYLCGHTSMTGWWWYFPFAVALKTTLTMLALFVAGSRMTRGPMRWAWIEWVATALAMIAVAMTSPLDVGVRYLLPAYPAIAIAAAATTLAMLHGSRVVRGIAVALLVLHAGVSLAAHPDYFPYFNALAGREPSRYLGDSNLDWGQDILRLRKVTRELHIPTLHLLAMSVADYPRLGFPPIENADPMTPSSGWVAVSEQAYVMGRASGGWAWLPKSYRRIGQSIRLYQVGIGVRSKVESGP